MSNLFFYCYFGKLATESYEMMADCIYDMDWYELPNGLQKYFILMIANMQKLIYYDGSGVAKLELGTFLKVIEPTFLSTFRSIIWNLISILAYQIGFIVLYGVQNHRNKVNEDIYCDWFC